MRSLVTGATGFLGSRIARFLRARGDDVRVLCRPTSDLRRLADLDVEIVYGDVTDRASIERAAASMERIFHAAGMYEFGPRDRRSMHAINVGGTENVLVVAKERRIRAIHVSSVVALGPTGKRVRDESHWTGDTPRSAYEATKREAHVLAREMARDGADVVIALPVTIYGPDDPSLTGMAHAWIAKGAVRVAAFADVAMTLVHVDDCAEAIVRMAERAEGGEELIVGERVVTFRTWLDAAARAAGRRPPNVYLPDTVVARFGSSAARLAPLAGFPRRLVEEGLAMSLGASWAFSGKRARDRLAWAPRTLEEGLGSTLAWYANGEGRRA